MDELSELDGLVESDILDALGEETSSDEINLENFDEDVPTNNNSNINIEDSSKNISQVNTSDLATLLSELLNNKTIEITIKIKD